MGTGMGTCRGPPGGTDWEWGQVSSTRYLFILIFLTHQSALNFTNEESKKRRRYSFKFSGRREDSLLLRFSRLLLLGAVLAVATHAKFTSGLIFAVDPLNGRIRPALHARRPRGRGAVRHVLQVASLAYFSSGLILAAVPLIGRIRPALHARRPRGRGDVQPVLVVARRAQFSSRILAVYPLTTGRIRPALHARRPRGHSNVPRLRRIWNSTDVSRDETACDGSHHAYECR